MTCKLNRRFPCLHGGKKKPETGGGIVKPLKPDSLRTQNHNGVAKTRDPPVSHPWSPPCGHLIPTPSPLPRGALAINQTNPQLSSLSLSLSLSPRSRRNLSSALAADSAAAMASSGGVVVEAFTEEEHEVASILRDLADLVRARHRRRRRRRVQREEIPSWGCRRPRTTPGEKKPAPPADVGRRHEAAASPDTPLAFLVPDESSGDDVAARAAPPRKAPASHAEVRSDSLALSSPPNSIGFDLILACKQY